MVDSKCQDVQRRVQKMWKQRAAFGQECSPELVYRAIISNRYALVRGAQLVRDELMLGFNSPDYKCPGASRTPGEEHWSVDLSNPTVLTTCGYTMCGDRICQSGALQLYKSMIANRFGSMTESGMTKPELFFATGGGTDSGPTLAHVTVGHALDSSIKHELYQQNDESCFLCNIDVCTHCGHFDVGPGNSAELAGQRYEGVGAVYGLAQESVYRDPRPTCGAIVGLLTNFNLQNPVHRRLRSDLGEENFNYLVQNDVCANDGSPVRFLIAACIIAVQGMRNTVQGLGPGGELDERGVGHMTAFVQVNNREGMETVLYCARTTVFNGEITEQGLGTDARRYSAVMHTVGGTNSVKLLYDGSDVFPIKVRQYKVVPFRAHTHAADDESHADLHMREGGKEGGREGLRRKTSDASAVSRQDTTSASLHLSDCPSKPSSQPESLSEAESDPEPSVCMREGGVGGRVYSFQNLLALVQQSTDDGDDQ